VTILQEQEGKNAFVVVRRRRAFVAWEKRIFGTKGIEVYNKGTRERKFRVLGVFG